MLRLFSLKWIEFYFLFSLEDLTNSKTEPMVRFLPLLLDKLISLIISPPLLNGQVLNCTNAAFESLAMIIGSLTVKHTFDVLLSSS